MYHDVSNGYKSTTSRVTVDQGLAPDTGKKCLVPISMLCTPLEFFASTFVQLIQHHKSTSVTLDHYYRVSIQHFQSAISLFSSLPLHGYLINRRHSSPGCVTMTRKVATSAEKMQPRITKATTHLKGKKKLSRKEERCH